MSCTDLPTVEITHQELEEADFVVSTHSSYYNDFFLLRTPITINGHPAVIEVASEEPILKVNGISVKLSTILQQAVAPVVIKHGVYQVENVYFEQVALFSVKFLSKSSLKQFLTDKEAIKKELSSAIVNLCKEESSSKSLLRQLSPTFSRWQQIQWHVVVGAKLYLVSPAVGGSPKVQQIFLCNHSSMVESWKRSKMFEFNTTMFTEPGTADATVGAVGSTLQPDQMSSSTSQESAPKDTSTHLGVQTAELAALQVEVKGIVEWFSLGVQLGIPSDELMKIRKDHRYTDDCRLEMLIQWEQLEKPSWSKLVTALVNIGRRDIAKKIVKKYGLPLPPLPVQEFQSGETVDKNVDSSESSHKTHAAAPTNAGNSISLLEDVIEGALQWRDAVNKALEMGIRTTLPKLQTKVSSLSKELRLLQTEVKGRQDENQTLKKALQPLKKSNEDIQRTIRENTEAIKALREEINTKEVALKQAKAALADKEKELSENVKELDVKSAQVIELQNELEEMRRKFNDQQKEMDQNLIESEALAQSREKYQEEMEIQQHIAVKEANKKKEEMQLYSKKLTDSENQITLISGKISEQEREMAKLREELQDSLTSDCTSEQLSAEEIKEHDEKEQQLLTLIMSAMKLQLELRRAKDETNQIKTKFKGAKRALEECGKKLTQQLEPKLPVNFKWSKAGANADIPFGMWAGPCAVVMNGDVYFGGGIASSIKDQQTVCIYNPSSDSWSQLPPYTYRWFSLTVINENQLVAVGGLNLDKRTNKLAVWDGKRRIWMSTLLPPMQTACSFPAVTTYDQWLLVAGGDGDECCLSRVEVLNVSTKQWYQVALLPPAGGQMSSTVIGNVWYLMGASVMSVSIHDIISEATDPQEGPARWNKLPPLSSTIFGFQGMLLAAGSSNPFTPSSTIYLYQPSTSKWIKIGDMPTKREKCACTVLPHGHIMMAGGVEKGQPNQKRVDLCKN